MKCTLFALVVAFAFCSLAFAQQKTTTYKDSINKFKITVIQTEPATKGGAVTVSSADTNVDSTYEVEYTDTPDDSTFVSDSQYDHQGNSSNKWDFLHEKFPDAAISGGIAIVVVTLTILFTFPLLIIFIAFYFRYKNRRNRYRLVEQALAAGQPIPEGLFNESLNLDTRSKGIKNICLGIGLFIFLWAFTDSFGLGSIGLLVMFTGIGQWWVARHPNSTNERK